MTYKQLKIKRNIWSRITQSYNVYCLDFYGNVTKRKIYGKKYKFNRDGLKLSAMPKITNDRWIVNIRDR